MKRFHQCIPFKKRYISTQTRVYYYYSNHHYRDDVAVTDGFHKVSSVDQGSLKMETSEMHFCHAFFVRGKKHLLARIKRKV